MPIGQDQRSLPDDQRPSNQQEDRPAQDHPQHVGDHFFAERVKWKRPPNGWEASPNNSPTGDVWIYWRAVALKSVGVVHRIDTDRFQFRIRNREGLAPRSPARRLALRSGARRRPFCQRGLPEGEGWTYWTGWRSSSSAIGCCGRATRY